eukprot:TRINITY_DN102335_c0_g1_i1.p1 TRINITY_DN102335_c0_g1~~TRINITY_DN102335_c0_g1_i1.p1  ORF type:complete len:389 (+),score=83.47 TRINITY_DN102335_c0_g1_i1:108-1169(+)
MRAGGRDLLCGKTVTAAVRDPPRDDRLKSGNSKPAKSRWQFITKYLWAEKDENKPHPSTMDKYDPCNPENIIRAEPEAILRRQIESIDKKLAGLATAIAKKPEFMKEELKEVIINPDSDDELGMALTVSDGKLFIQDVNGGIMRDWNNIRAESSRLGNGDRILSVNGVRKDPRAMLKELQSDSSGRLPPHLRMDIQMDLGLNRPKCKYEHYAKVMKELQDEREALARDLAIEEVRKGLYEAALAAAKKRLEAAAAASTRSPSDMDPSTTRTTSSRTRRTTSDLDGYVCLLTRMTNSSSKLLAGQREKVAPPPEVPLALGRKTLLPLGGEDHPKSAARAVLQVMAKSVTAICCR